MSNTTVLTRPTLSKVYEQPTTQAHAEGMPLSKVSAYYRFYAKIYDLTRWTFLFGRHWLIDWLPFKRLDKITIMEVGCGTGYNLAYLSKSFPKAQLIGVDSSKSMLRVAHEKMRDTPNKLTLLGVKYDKNTLKNSQNTEGGGSVEA